MAKDKNSGFRLMGFGHRVYKNYDPRATIIKRTCDKLLAKLHINDPIFDIAQELEAGRAVAIPTSSSGSCIRTSISTRA